MFDWFKWKGELSTAYGITVQHQPPITLAQERADAVTVFGRSGSFTKLEGEDVYDDILFAFEIATRDEYITPSLAAWLRGSGQLEIANRPGGYYEGRLNNQIKLERMLQGNRSGELIFRCQPYFYHSVSPISTLTTSGTLYNPGNVASAPLIVVSGTGDIVLTVGTQVVELDSVVDSITMDSQLMLCYKGTANTSAQMTGSYILLEPGSNAISWTGTVTSVAITPRWRDV